jgi:hypothetical protein
MDISDTVNECGEEVNIPQFKNPSTFSKALRHTLRATILPFCDKENRPEYNRQFDSASRNLELTVEGLLKLFARHPIKGTYVVTGVFDWLGDYFSAQKETAAMDRYLVYTQKDMRIPFRPEEDIMYVYMIAQIANIIKEAASILPKKDLRHLVETFQDANDMAVEVFKKHPTTMPRFKDHQRISLKFIQSLDAPVNCCPSLHIGYSMLLDNVAREIIAPKKPETAASIRYATQRMVNSVLYTAQHTLIDVAFGMLCAKRVFEKRYNKRYDDLMYTFPKLQEKHPKIDYEEIRKVYEEGATALTHRQSLADVIGEYLTANKYPLLGAQEDVNKCYFDTKRKELIRT